MELKGKNIVVFGLGLSGIGALKFLHKKEANLYCVNSEHPRNWKKIEEVLHYIKKEKCFAQEQGDLFKSLPKIDYIIKAPGISWEVPFLQDAINKNIKIISEIELALAFIKLPLIAITGSNGKTTTVMMLEYALKEQGYKVFTGGNIGRSLCDLFFDDIKYDYLLLELSSFQLELVERMKPRVAIILNTSLNHGERYEDFFSYQKAKFNITKNLTDTDLLIWDKKTAQCFEFMGREITVDLNNISEIKDSILNDYSLSSFRLIGDHNLLNLYFVIQALGELGDFKIGIQRMIDYFSGVEHRVEYIGLLGGCKFYNDAKSTNWRATIKALESMPEKSNLCLIVGGKLRGQDDLPSKGEIALIAKVTSKVFLIGEAGKILEKELNGQITVDYCGDLEKAVEKIKSLKEFEITLFSPAYPSFDQFENYIDRGNSFKKLITNRNKNE